LTLALMQIGSDGATYVRGIHSLSRGDTIVAGICIECMIPADTIALT
jgi:hypothetical protein